MCGGGVVYLCSRWASTYAAVVLALLVFDLGDVSLDPLAELESLVLAADSLLLESLALSLFEGLVTACSDALALALAP